MGVAAQPQARPVESHEVQQLCINQQLVNQLDAVRKLLPVSPKKKPRNPYELWGERQSTK